MAEFAYNNNTHTSTGTSPFKANYGYELTFNGTPTPNQCVPAVEQRLKQLNNIQEEAWESLEAAQEAMKDQFDKHVRQTPLWKVGDGVWLNSRNIATTRPSPKLDHRWLGPFSISEVILPSMYKLTLPLSMKGIHPVFHVSILRKHNPNTIQHQRTAAPAPIQLKEGVEWEIEEILDRRKRGQKTEYWVSWKGWGPQENSWEPEGNLKNCKESVEDFNKRFPEAASKHRKRRRK
jgi:hypothetical protein